MNLRTMPVLGKPKDGRLGYRASPALRVFFLLSSVGLVAIGSAWSADDGTGRLLFYSAALILAMSALTENRWVFFAAVPEGTTATASSRGGHEPPSAVRRSFGVIPVLRRWELPRERLYSISLRAGKSGESHIGSSVERDRMEASLHGMDRHDWVALVLGLSDGKSLVLAACRKGQHARLRQDGLAIAAHLGLSFEDGSGLAPKAEASAGSS